MPPRPEIALLVEPSRQYDRRIIRGVAEYIKRQRCDWSLYIEDDPIARLPDLETWAGDGVIANFDDRGVARTVAKLGIPIIGVGGGHGYYTDDLEIPYVFIDNRAIARLAAQHLLDLGFQRFAFCSEPPTRTNGWARQRAEAFCEHIEQAGFRCNVFVGRYNVAKQWRAAQTALLKWLAKLKPPVGLMACNDARARHVLQACWAVGLRVPDDVAIVGVDNDDIMCELTQPPLTSVELGATHVGYEAAALLDRMMAGQKPKQRQYIVNFEGGVVARQSTDVMAVNDEAVANALRFIRNRACDGIQVQDVLEVAMMSRTNLENKFRTILGRTIHTEIRRVRIEEAKRLLSTTNLAIKEIVQRCGISSVQYLSVMIRQATGHTPGEIRKARLG